MGPGRRLANIFQWKKRSVTESERIRGNRRNRVVPTGLGAMWKGTKVLEVCGMVETAQEEVALTLWPFGWARTVLRGENLAEVTLHEGTPPEGERAAASAWWNEGTQTGAGEGVAMATARATGRWWLSAPPSCAVFGTPFQNAVWQAVSCVPAGKVVSYGALAAAMGQPRAVRAVAGALAANRVALWVPCHRVGPTGGDLGGFRWGPRMKAALREFEISASL
jgi:O-6-methylguanine DNA methyltransferase